MASASNLFSALTKGSLVISAILAAKASANRAMGIEPGADRRAALRQLIKAVQGELDAFDAVIDLRRIAAEFLP